MRPPNSWRRAPLYVFLLLIVPTTSAQDRLRGEPVVVDEHRPPHDSYRSEQSLISDLLQTVVGLVRDVSLSASGDAAADRLFAFSDRLSGVAGVLPQDIAPNSGHAPLRADDLEQVRIVLADLVDQVVNIRHELRIEGHRELADRLRDVENGLLDAVGMVAKLERTRSDGSDRRDDAARRAEGERRRAEGDRHERETRRQSWTRGEWRKHTRGAGWKNGNTANARRLAGIHVGELGYGWPYRETGVYRPIPAIRYNRVEGLVLGLRRLPLSWDSYERGRAYGHVGYAFGTEDWQYELGGEARAGKRRRTSEFDLKVGASYRRGVATHDIWKTSWIENTLGAFLLNYDILDYHEVEGWTAYAGLRLTRFVQVTGGYRQESYRSLSSNVTWSLFGGRDFRPNPPIIEGDMNSIVVALEGGKVADLDWLPAGAVFRFEAEFGRGFGGDFDFNRYVGDARVYIPIDYSGTLALRVRGGTSDGVLPFQKAYTLGGLGSLRSYPNNGLLGSRMLLGNVEYTVRQGWLWDDFMLSGFVDAGWVNAASNRFRFDDVYPSAGIGVGLIERTLRLELSWPLRDVGGSREPSFWIRVNPAF